jgi:tetratricopeptide (TPR) repeat protein
MSQNPDELLIIRKYLLGQLDDEGRRQFEEQLFLDDDLFADLLAVEDELIDEHLAGELSTDETQVFEKNFLITAERRQKLSFAKALRRYTANQRTTTNSAQQIVSRPSVPTRNWWQLFTASPLAGAAIAVLVIAAGFGLWRVFLHKSDVDSGLIALNNAYKQQRPIEARITKLDYAPFVTLRGNEPVRVDARELEISERYLLDAVRDHPDAASHHALGKVYLAKRDFDRAISEFENARTLEPTNAQVYADLGAAFLERAKVSLPQENEPERPPQSSSTTKPGKRSEDLGHALENLNKALELNGNLLEAQFNRALCYQYMMLPEQAAESWRRYLERDTTSRWAEEARRNLQIIEAQKANAGTHEQELFEKFQKAYQSGDDETAWRALSQTHTRAGNLIVDHLLDSYLSDDGPQQTEKLKPFSYAARLCLARAGDRLYSDVNSFYDRSSLQDRQVLTLARSRMKAGVETFNKGEFDHAIPIFAEARESFNRMGEPAEGLLAQSWEGYARLRIPQKQESVALFESVLDESNQRGYANLKANALNALADAKLSNNEYSEALAYANQCAKLSETIDDPANQVRCLTQSQSLQLIFGDYGQSLEFMRTALTVSEDLPWQPKLLWPVYHEGALAANFLSLPASAIA